MSQCAFVKGWQVGLLHATAEEVSTLKLGLRPSASFGASEIVIAMPSLGLLKPVLKMTACPTGAPATRASAPLIAWQVMHEGCENSLSLVRHAFSPGEQGFSTAQREQRQTSCHRSHITEPGRDLTYL